MGVTLRQLRAFVAVAAASNFTAAAEAMGMAQPMVSGLIRDLEAELGFRLFDRTTRRVEVTEAAREFLADARRLTADLDGAERRARDVGARRRGHLGVGAPPLLAAALLPGVMDAFARSSPGVSVALVDRPVPAILGLLRAGEVHLAVGTFGDDEVGLARVPLITDRFFLLCRADHPAATLAAPRWADLAGLPLVTLRPGNGIREQVERGHRAAGLDVRPAYELDQIATVVAMVASGLGVTALPLYALTALAAPPLIARPLADPAVTREIAVAHRADRSPSPTAADFVRLLKAGAARLRAEGERLLGPDAAPPGPA